LHVRIGKYNNENIINTKIPSSSSITCCVHVTPKDKILKQQQFVGQEMDAIEWMEKKMSP